MKFCKIIFVFLGMVALLASCFVVSAFETDDPYGPVVNCDADQPMDNLLKCVEKEYNKRTKGKYNSFAMDTDIFYKDKKNSSYILPTNYKLINNFHSIKSCYKNNFCNDFIKDSGEGNIKRDYYDKDISVHQDTAILSGSVYVDSNNSFSRSKKNQWILSFYAAPYMYSRSYKLERDIVISEFNKKLVIYGAIVERIFLLGNKDLYVANIQRLCPARIKNKPDVWNKDLYLYVKYDNCGVYRFSYVRDHQNSDIPVSISLDKRINPKAIFVKIGRDKFEVDISNDFQLIYE